MEMKVDDGVKRRIMAEGRDYRVCTSCTGPALVPITVKPPKASDLVVKIGSNILYISRVQANYICEVTEDMFYDDDEIDSCPVFYRRRP